MPSGWKHHAGGFIRWTVFNNLNLFFVGMAWDGLAVPTFFTCSSDMVAATIRIGIHHNYKKIGAYRNEQFIFWLHHWL